MRPHVRFERGGQGIEGDLFEPVGKLWLTFDGKQDFEREEIFDNGAQLGAL